MAINKAPSAVYGDVCGSGSPFDKYLGGIHSIGSIKIQTALYMCIQKKDVKCMPAIFIFWARIHSAKLE